MLFKYLVHINVLTNINEFCPVLSPFIDQNFIFIIRKVSKHRVQLVDQLNLCSKPIL